jgi:hypothetical protein
VALTRDSVLWYWDAFYGIQPVVGGDPVFSRDSAGAFHDRQGHVRSLIPGLPRFTWAEIGGVTRPVLQLEMARTNIWNISEPALADLPTRSAGVQDKDPFPHRSFTQGIYYPGNTGADEYAYAQPGLGANTTYTVSIYVVMDDGGAPVVNQSSTSGDFVVIVEGGIVGTATVEHVGGALYRVQVTHPVDSTVNSGSVGVARYTGNSQRGFTVTGYQTELGSSATAYIRTNGVDATRAVDQLHFTDAPRPRAQAAYLRFRVRSLDTHWLWQMGPDVNSGARWICYRSSGYWRNFLSNGSAVAEAVVLSSARVGDTIELVCITEATGALAIHASVNEAAVSSGTAAAPTGGLPSAWAGTNLWLNSIGANNAGANHYAELKVVDRADLAATTGQGIMEELRALSLSASGDLL